MIRSQSGTRAARPAQHVDATPGAGDQRISQALDCAAVVPAALVEDLERRVPADLALDFRKQATGPGRTRVTEVVPAPACNLRAVDHISRIHPRHVEHHGTQPRQACVEGRDARRSHLEARQTGRFELDRTQRGRDAGEKLRPRLFGDGCRLPQAAEGARLSEPGQMRQRSRRQHRFDQRPFGGVEADDGDPGPGPWCRCHGCSRRHQWIPMSLSARAV